MTISNIPCNPADRDRSTMTDERKKAIVSFFTLNNYNPQVCANLVFDTYERCLRNDNNIDCIVSSSPFVYYPCNKLGINVVVCLIQTYG